MHRTNGQQPTVVDGPMVLVEPLPGGDLRTHGTWTDIEVCAVPDRPRARALWERRQKEIDEAVRAQSPPLRDYATCPHCGKALK